MCSIGGWIDRLDIGFGYGRLIVATTIEII
jgi:hypothetical protein